ncbi:MAG: DUF4852 domain-containing protein [Alphaproteobacteria bacterium]|nr:DUF4852 domain-containing protein [Alphaproteobacteria bacterium]
MKFVLFLSGVLVALLILSAPGYATTEFIVKKDHIYEKPTMEELSRLYWSLGALDFNNDAHVDNYLLINECGIYQEYRHNEFEWSQIRESTREHIKSAASDFPRRLEFLQPLYLGEYNIEGEYFDIAPDYVKPTSRRLEVLTKAQMGPICNQSGEIEGYPKGLLVELTRPFGIDKIPVPKDKAEGYIAEKLEEFNKLLEHMKTRKRFLESRDAYILMQIRVFGYKGPEKIEDGYTLNAVFAVLEGMEVYADRDRRDLLFKQKFDFYKEPSEFEQRLQQQYQALMNNELFRGPDIQDETKGLGLLHIAEKLVEERKSTGAFLKRRILTHCRHRKSIKISAARKAARRHFPDYL